jgi:predicted ATP-dependent endonuclease of OLD family
MDADRHQQPQATGYGPSAFRVAASLVTGRLNERGKRVVRINRLEIENVKRVQAVQIEPSATGLTLIGGRNGQGKTSVLDAIMWAIGGAKYKPSDPKRADSMADPRIRIELDNGIVVTRDGKNASLKVVDQHGNKAGQNLLDELIGQLALDLPKFVNASPREKAETLLQIIGVGQQLQKLDADAERIYNERHAIGQVHTRKQKHAEDLPFEQGVPECEVSAAELIQRQQAILARNGQNQQLRLQRDQLARQIQEAATRVAAIRASLADAETKHASLVSAYETANKTAATLVDESTAELEQSLNDIDDTNRRVRINAQKRQAEAEASELLEQVDALTQKLESVRAERMRLLSEAKLPLAGLSVDGGELTYLGKKWDCMSGSDQLRVAVAIVRQLKPECRFVLLDKTEQMDLQTLAEFGTWLEQEGLQVIATRVSTGEECSIIIDDGLVTYSAKPEATMPPAFVTTDEEGF